MLSHVHPRMRKMRTLHFIGVGGVGMAGIAEVLLREGYHVTGSDIASNPLIQSLSALGAKVALTHSPDNIREADVVVISSAISPENIELQAAKKARIPIIPRAQMLGELMRFRQGIAIAGTHGKTTTTSLVASLLAAGGLDPTFVIGGRLNSAGSTAYLGSGKYLVAEADESDASFLHLQPMMAVVTNIDQDHMETYDHDFSKLKNTFLKFLSQLPFYGLAVLCLDDPVLSELIDQVTKPVLTYGFHPDADIRAVDFYQRGTQTYFSVLQKNYAPLLIQLNLPGRHNVLNTLSAIAIARDLGVSDEKIVTALREFKGVGRRFEQIGEYVFLGGRASVIDDYGHHPKEVMSTIEAVRSSWPDCRIAMIFQPHRFTRTRDLFDDFAKVLSEVDVLFLLNIYSAGEPPIEGIDSRALCRAIRNLGKIEPILIDDTAELPRILSRVLKNQDILISQGAGNVSSLVRALVS